METPERKPIQHFWKLNIKSFAKIWYAQKVVKDRSTKLERLEIETSEFKQINVLAYILQSIRPGDNTFILTYQKIAKDTGVSKDTVLRIMRRLGEKDFVRKVQNGVYVVNPYMLVWGPDSKRDKIFHTVYKDAARLGEPSRQDDPEAPYSPDELLHNAYDD
jgi:DNA-binding transcriptional regulator YhcF (GntR family)